MSQTESILEQAQDIARRKFEEPSERTVMEIFSALSMEIDRAGDLLADGNASLH